MEFVGASNDVQGSGKMKLDLKGKKGMYIFGAVITGYLLIMFLAMAPQAFSGEPQEIVMWLVIQAVIVTFFIRFLLKYRAEKAKASAGPIPPSKQSLKQNPKNQAPQQQAQIKITLPAEKNGAPLAYKYSDVRLQNVNANTISRIFEAQKWEIRPENHENRILLFWENMFVGEVPSGKLSEMFCDWLRRGDPLTVLLQAYNQDSGETFVFIAFYRDKRKTLANKEREVVKLIAYSSESKQSAISMLSKGDELLLDDYEDDNGNNVVDVLGFLAEPIGRLPKKQVTKYFENGIAACYFDHADFDDDKEKDIPYIEIYWN